MQTLKYNYFRFVQKDCIWVNVCSYIPTRPFWGFNSNPLIWSPSEVDTVDSLELNTQSCADVHESVTSLSSDITLSFSVYFKRCTSQEQDRTAAATQLWAGFFDHYVGCCCFFFTFADSVKCEIVKWFEVFLLHHGFAGSTQFDVLWHVSHLTVTSRRRNRFFRKFKR